MKVFMRPFVGTLWNFGATKNQGPVSRKMSTLPMGKDGSARIKAVRNHVTISSTFYEQLLRKKDSTVFFALLGSVYVKALCVTMMMKLTLGIIKSHLPVSVLPDGLLKKAKVRI
jgi:hypothetical protein